jgi:ubiquinone/menaquinone biosynthesis C-methylase UbiE
MLRQLRVWWTIITQMGPATRVARQLDVVIRSQIIQVLADEDLFDYLQEPRTYGQILAEFGYMDSSYTRELLDILAVDKHNVLVKEDSTYRLNSAQSLPTCDQALHDTDGRYHSLAPMFEGLGNFIPARLRGEPLEFTEAFETNGRFLLQKFNDSHLGSRIYTAIRNAAFAILSAEDRAWLRGKTLLDLGCGGGLETAELWLHLDGEVRATGIDLIIGLVEIAEQNFPAILGGLKASHPPLTDTNRPVFEAVSFTNLPYDDNTFDAAFHSQILHWTPAPHKAIREIARVVKPGGLVFGAQGGKPDTNPYMDLLIRVNENCNGFFWTEEFRRWYAEEGVKLEHLTPAGIFCGRVRKPQ